jgi:DNA-binding MarR family transcriptional regulator
MEKEDDVQRLIRLFTRFERRQKKFLTRVMENDGIKSLQVRYIITLARQPGVSQDYLADFHSVDKSYVARGIRQLEKLGLVSRVSDEKDRRYYQLFLTAKGKKSHAKIQQAFEEWGNFVSAGVSTENIRASVETLQKMIENIDAPGAVP